MPQCEHLFEVRVLRANDESEHFGSADVHTVAKRIAEIKAQDDAVDIVAWCKLCSERDEWMRTPDGWTLVSDEHFEWRRYRHLITAGLLTWAIVIVAIARCSMGAR